MAYLACDKDGTETIYFRKPFRGGEKYHNGLWLPSKEERDEQTYINLPHGSIAKLIGRELTWSDEPVKYE
ncbi:MAG: fructan hydrolase [Muribaculaceae bacterium]|nr:fructan hydrolase [Muribaculaceae bacterium]